MKEPVLARVERPGYVLQIEGGLHKIGAQKPYFSITANEYVNRRLESCDCLHEAILKERPEFAPLVAMHLSDEDGIPMHAASNSWYQLVGAMPILQGNERYHAGNSQHHCNGEYRNPNADECLQSFMKYVRVDRDTALELVATLTRIYNDVPQYQRVWEGQGSKMAWEAFKVWIEAQKPRWKHEADAVRQQFNLVVFGN